MINVLNTTRLTVGGTMYRALFEGKDMIFTVNGKRMITDASVVVGNDMIEAPIELKADLYQAFKEHEAKMESRIGLALSAPSLAELEAAIGQDIDGDQYITVDGTIKYYNFSKILDKAVKEGLNAECPIREEE